ncbi:hypothetical protein [Cerasicoccus maritimus]|uniref:hypothetical protein n=1 Tax=Cerasicoccus maritimus TaxID=490089 RepID=UPI002852619F|nr:hypothetical protein [Cerasicoccus maritimus]
MPSDSFLPTPKRHIPKWPFWLGDVLLVGTGIALAFSQGAPLSPLAMAWVVISIVSGAVLACAPFVVEFVVNAKGGGSGDYAEVRNKVLKLEFRLAELELNGGGAPESARIAQSRYSRFTEDEDDLGVGTVTKQPKAETPIEETKPQALKFGPTGAALVGRGPSQPTTSGVSPEDPEPIAESAPSKPKSKPPFRIQKAPVIEEPDEHDYGEPDEDLPTSLDDIGPAEKRDPKHLRKALDQARKEAGSKAVSRLIRGGKS